MRSDALPEQILQLLGGGAGGQQVLQVMSTEDGQQVLQLIPQSQPVKVQPSGPAQRPQTPQQTRVSPAPPQQQIVQIVDSAGKKLVSIKCLVGNPTL